MKYVLGALFLCLYVAAKPQQDREPLGVKGGVKGGGNQWPSQNVFHGTASGGNMRNFTGHSSTSNHSTPFFNNGTVMKDYEKGVCYEEVLTATLVKDQNNVPMGNGVSRSSLI
jgi:hypothetical protein